MGHEIYGILAPWPGIGRWSLNHWPEREALTIFFFFLILELWYIGFQSYTCPRTMMLQMSLPILLPQDYPLLSTPQSKSPSSSLLQSEVVCFSLYYFSNLLYSIHSMTYVLLTHHLFANKVELWMLSLRCGFLRPALEIKNKNNDKIQNFMNASRRLRIKIQGDLGK